MALLRTGDQNNFKPFRKRSYGAPETRLRPKCPDRGAGGSYARANGAATWGTEFQALPEVKPMTRYSAMDAHWSRNAKARIPAEGAAPCRSARGNRTRQEDPSAYRAYKLPSKSMRVSMLKRKQRGTHSVENVSSDYLADVELLSRNLIDVENSRKIDHGRLSAVLNRLSLVSDSTISVLCSVLCGSSRLLSRLVQLNPVDCLGKAAHEPQISMKDFDLEDVVSVTNLVLSFVLCMTRSDLKDAVMYELTETPEDIVALVAKFAIPRCSENVANILVECARFPGRCLNVLESSFDEMVSHITSKTQPRVVNEALNVLEEVLTCDPVACQEFFESRLEIITTLFCYKITMSCKSAVRERFFTILGKAMCVFRKELIVRVVERIGARLKDGLSERNILSNACFFLRELRGVQEETVEGALRTCVLDLVRSFDEREPHKTEVADETVTLVEHLYGTGSPEFRRAADEALLHCIHLVSTLYGNVFLPRWLDRAPGTCDPEELLQIREAFDRSPHVEIKFLWFESEPVTSLRLGGTLPRRIDIRDASGILFQGFNAAGEPTYYASRHGVILSQEFDDDTVIYDGDGHPALFDRQGRIFGALVRDGAGRPIKGYTLDRDPVYFDDLLYNSSGELIDELAVVHSPDHKGHGCSFVRKLEAASINNVWLGKHHSTGKTVVVKEVSLKDNLDRTKDLAPIRRECRLLASMNHPNIVKFVHLGVSMDDEYEEFKDETLAQAQPQVSRSLVSDDAMVDDESHPEKPQGANIGNARRRLEEKEVGDSADNVETGADTQHEGDSFGSTATAEDKRIASKGDCGSGDERVGSKQYHGGNTYHSGGTKRCGDEHSGASELQAEAKLGSGDKDDGDGGDEHGNKASGGGNHGDQDQYGDDEGSDNDSARSDGERNSMFDISDGEDDGSGHYDPFFDDNAPSAPDSFASARLAFATSMGNEQREAVFQRREEEAKVPEIKIGVNRIYIVTERHGASLHNVIEKFQHFCQVREGLPEWTVREIMAPSMSALRFLHGHKIAHRDFKPRNCLVNEQLEVRLCDFGDARKFVRAEYVTAAGGHGTDGFTAPEQCTDDDALLKQHMLYPFKADYFSFGCSLFYAIMGRPLHDVDTMTGRVRNFNVPFPKMPGVSTACISLIKACVQSKIAERINESEFNLDHPWFQADIEKPSYVTAGRKILPTCLIGDEELSVVHACLRQLRKSAPAGSKPKLTLKMLLEADADEEVTRKMQELSMSTAKKRAGPSMVGAGGHTPKSPKKSAAWTPSKSMHSKLG